MKIAQTKPANAATPYGVFDSQLRRKGCLPDATNFHSFHIQAFTRILGFVYCKKVFAVGLGVAEPVSKIRYRSGLAIPRSGIYIVRHKEHRLPHEVTLLKDETFPPCAQCSKAVQFELLIGITDAEFARSAFKVTLHQLPEIEIDSEATPAAAASKEKAG